ncbi:uncharacterized protein LOC130737274 [Lotus japonicus]|uniref:uncharacterized protein LOC130737274 n=1 Tax=Lotus japonicus TaxID=34305 RepID=UPI00258E7B78|nr:uncharacterized protein LOC130737274 [Lotus japonicus]
MVEMSPHGSESSFGSSLTENQWISRKVSKQETNKWTHLPQDILEQIMKRLCLTDYLTMRAICSSWRSTVTNAIANKYCHPLPELPLVVFISHEQTFFSLKNERGYCPKSSLFDSTSIFCHGSIEGWMILSNYNEDNSLSFTFFNPVTTGSVSVPPPLYFPFNTQIQDMKLSMGKMVVSSTPDGYDSDCFLAGLCNDFCHIAFYRLFDESWNMIEIEKDSVFHFLDIEIMGSKLYVRTNRPLNSMLVYDLKDSTNGSPKHKVLSVLPEKSTPQISRTIDSQRHISGHAFCRLAKHEKLKQLFLIYVICSAVYKPEDVNYMNMVTKFVNSPDITGVEVFKLDMNKEPIAWTKCESLDDNVVFVSYCKSMVMSRAAFNSTHKSIIRENSVYFALSFECLTDPCQDIQFGIRHLTDSSSTKYFSVEKSDHSDVPYPFWFVPSI